MNYANIGNQVLVLFLIMMLGYGARKWGIIDKRVNKGLTDLLLNITLPAMIVISFNFEFSKDMMLNSMKLLMFSVIIHLSLILISSLLYYKLPDNLKGVARFVTIFSNCGFMGYPVAESVYGKEGVFYTAVFNIPFNILIWTVGVALFTNKKSLKEMKGVLLNPGILATFAGMIIFLLSIKLPLPIYNALDLVGGVTTPLSMIVIGAMLAETSIKEVFSGLELYYVTFVRLIAVPAAGLIVLKLLGVESILLGIPVLIMAMPAAANAAIISEKYGGDSLFASRAVFITTIFSLITIPLIIMFI